MRIRNFLTAVAVVVFFLSIMAADSESWTPFIMLVASWAYLALEGWRSGWLGNEPEWEEEE